MHPREQKRPLVLAISALLLAPFIALSATQPKADFNREIRPILSENCYKCHGPDDGSRKAKLRLDIPGAPLKPAKSGAIPIVPGSPEKSELISRITATDEDDRMPPVKSGKKLSAAQIETLQRWVSEGANYSTHWSYVKPARPELPQVKNPGWGQNAIDRFILARLEREHLQPSNEVERHLLIRRVSLDLTGLPPTLAEVDDFVKDTSPNAYEKLVDRLLAKPAFGEHWARMWLDLARYADSAGYADDPPRTIWAYRDYVIRAFNSNKPFDRFTLEQIAGDLLPDCDDDDEIASAFHRNTMTNNEGGTSDEEFRNAAVVDRVNTTMAVWMGTSMACAQCHNHKYDPLSQQEYFRLFAIFNNSADADLKDESPLFNIYSSEQKQQRAKWQSQIAAIEKRFHEIEPPAAEREVRWEEGLSHSSHWTALEPATLTSSGGGTVEHNPEHVFQVSPLMKSETYTARFALTASHLTGLKLELLPNRTEPERGIYGITHVVARLQPSVTNATARFVRIELPGEDRILSLAEVEVRADGTNVARRGTATQSSTDYEGEAQLAIDGNSDGKYENKFTTHTQKSANPWWELDLKESKSIESISVWNRTDGEIYTRLEGFTLTLLDQDHKPVWIRRNNKAEKTKTVVRMDEAREIDFAAVYGDLNPAAGESDPRALIAKQPKAGTKGWLVDPLDKQTHSLTFVPAEPVTLAPGTLLEVAISQKAEHERCPLAGWRVSVAEDEKISEFAKVPEDLLRIIASRQQDRKPDDSRKLLAYYRETIDPELSDDRLKLAKLKKKIAELQPETVPVMRELEGEKRRKTHIQFRGNYLALGDEVTEGIPAVFNPLPKGQPANRLSLARWLVDENNPLTARVAANRFWEQIFGTGLVRTIEEFGSQGEPPTHPALLDWLATELVRTKWDVKNFLKLLVTSSTYRQTSRVTPELQERDPDNLLLARGPRFRIPAEVVRDQALAVSGLLSSKMYGPPVRPPQPSLGLTAAFGGSLDWKTSEGEDRYRRALYIEWRRTSLYPSISTFDAPSREVCALKRTRSNTPLQALVTLNDPVYVEAAQALARRMMDFESDGKAHPASDTDKITRGFELCLARAPSEFETGRLTTLLNKAAAEFEKAPDRAKEMATNPRGSPPTGTHVARLAAFTVVANVLLNTDEFLMKP